MWMEENRDRLFTPTGRLRGQHDRDGRDVRPGIVYAILHPVSAEPVYVGKTGKRMKTRGHQHHRMLVQGEHPNRPLQMWWDALPADSRAFRVVTLQECLPGTMNACECEWIARYQEKGHNLLNLTSGGGSYCFDEKVRAGLSEKSKQLWADPKYRDRCLAATRRRFGVASGVKSQAKAERARKRTEEQVARQVAERQREAERNVVWLTVKGAVAVIPLTRGLRALVDADMVEIVGGHVWHAKAGGGARTTIMRRKIGLGRMVYGSSGFTPVRRGRCLDYRRLVLPLQRPVPPARTMYRPSLA
jgi:hypothetical protein